MKPGTFFFAFIYFLGCTESRPPVLRSEKKDSSVKREQIMKTELQNDAVGSFVISCGSGCAITYTAVEIYKFDNHNKVNFNIETYIDEVSQESSQQTFVFYYGNDNLVEKITEEGNHDNILEPLPEGASNSFRNFTNSLIKNKKNAK